MLRICFLLKNRLIQLIPVQLCTCVTGTLRDRNLLSVAPPAMDDYPATSLRKISSAKKKRRSGRTPRKTTMPTAQSLTGQSPTVVTRQAISKNARKSQTTAPSCISRQHLTADIRDLPSDKILCPQVRAKLNNP